MRELCTSCATNGTGPCASAPPTSHSVRTRLAIPTPTPTALSTVPTPSAVRAAAQAHADREPDPLPQQHERDQQPERDRGELQAGLLDELARERRRERGADQQPADGPAEGRDLAERTLAEAAQRGEDQHHDEQEVQRVHRTATVLGLMRDDGSSASTRTVGGSTVRTVRCER